MIGRMSGEPYERLLKGQCPWIHTDTVTPMRWLWLPPVVNGARKLTPFRRLKTDPSTRYGLAGVCGWCWYRGVAVAGREVRVDGWGARWRDAGAVVAAGGACPGGRLGRASRA